MTAYILLISLALPPEMGYMTKPRYTEPVYKARAHSYELGVTDYVVLGTIALVIGYDVYASTNDNLPTISERIWTFTVRYPFIPFLAGFLCGHLFWQS